MQLKRLLLLVKSLLPIKVPTTNKELEKLCSDVIALGGWEDDDGYRVATAHSIMQLGAQTIVKSTYFFYASVRAQVAKQTAINLMRDINNKPKVKDDNGQQDEKTSGPLVS